MSALTSLGQGGGSASGSRVKATGTVYARPLSDRFADYINVKDFGAKGDGVTDDTVAIQNADNFASLIIINDKVSRLGFPTGQYLAGNIQKGRAEWWGAGRYATFILATEVANDNRYLIASPSWLVAGSQYGDRPTGMYDMTIDALEKRTNAYVLRSYFTTLEGVHVKGGIDHDLLISTDAADGTAHASDGSIGNINIVRCWFGFDSAVTKYNIRQIDTAHVNTDCHLLGCFMSGATVMNVSLLNQVAGWKVFGNHMYGAPISIRTTHGPGFRIPGNLFEGDCIFQSSNDAYQPVSIGPDNWFWGAHVSAYFENNGATIDQMVFFNNRYSDQTELRHCYNVASKILVSKDEIFMRADPFQFYSGATPAGSSSGVFQIQNAKLHNVAQTISCSFTGVGSSNAAYPSKPSSLSTNPAYADLGSLGWHHKAGHPQVPQGNEAFADRNTAISLATSIPIVANYRGFIVEVDVYQTFNFSSTVRTKFARRYGVTKNPNDGSYVFVNLSETYSSGEWTVAPSVAAADANGICTVTLTGTPATTDGYGMAIIRVGGFLS